MVRRTLPLFALLAPLMAEAAAPPLIPITGYLTDTTGAPIDGTQTLHLNLYGATGPAIWTENQTVDVDNGQFTVYLGDVTTVDLQTFRDNGVLFLGVAVGTGSEMTPRFELATAPFAGYAQYCDDADTVGGIDPADFLQVGDAITWNSITGRPTGLDDGDQGADYLNGAGLNLSGSTFSVDQPTIDAWAKAAAFDSLLELQAELDSVYMARQTCTANQVLMANSSGVFVCTDASALPVGPAAPPAWTSITGRPSGLDDGDNDTTYTAGNGLALAGGAFSMSEYAGGPLIPNARFETGNLTGWTVVSGAGTVSADASNAAGGFSFKNTANSVAWVSSNTRIPVRPGQTYEVSGKFRRIDTVAVSAGTVYLAVRFFNSGGLDIAGGDGTWHYYPLAGAEIGPRSAAGEWMDNNWHTVSLDFGEGARAIPAGAVTMTVGAILNYNSGNRLYETTDLQINAVQDRGSYWRTGGMSGGWVNYDTTYNPWGYMKDAAGIVHLRGLVRSGTVGQTIYTLPPGFRPAYQELHTCTANGAYCRIDVTPAGAVNISAGSAAWTSLDGITFPAAN